MSETPRQLRLARGNSVYYAEAKPPFENCEAMNNNATAILASNCVKLAKHDSQVFTFAHQGFEASENERDVAFFAHIESIEPKLGEIDIDYTLREVASGQESLFEAKYEVA